MNINGEFLEKKKKLFHDNPNINPDNGRKLIQGKIPLIKFVDKYALPDKQIIPVTDNALVIKIQSNDNDSVIDEQSISNDSMNNILDKLKMILNQMHEIHEEYISINKIYKTTNEKFNNGIIPSIKNNVNVDLIFELSQVETIAVHLLSKINDMDSLYKLFLINKKCYFKLLNDPYVLNQIVPNFYIKGIFKTFRDFNNAYINYGGGPNPNFDIGFNPHNYGGHTNYYNKLNPSEKKPPLIPINLRWNKNMKEKWLEKLKCIQCSDEINVIESFHYHYQYKSFDSKILWSGYYSTFINENR